MFKMNEPKEIEVQSACTEYLDMLRVFWWRQNNGVAVYKNKDGSDRRVKYGDEGKSDLGCIAGGDVKNNIRGTYVAIEVKTPKEHKFLLKHYDRIKSGNCKTKRDWHLFSQIAFITNVRESGGEGFFVSSVADLEREFRCHGLIRG